MTIFAIGEPGKPPRLLVVDPKMETVGATIGPGEVVLEVPTVGDWVISSDGEAVNARAIQIAELRPLLLSQIDQEAEATRQLFITPGSGQLGTYLNKQAEAAAYLADNSAPTPYLTAEAAATGTTVPNLAALVHATATAWLAVDIRIEAARRGAKEAVINAADVGAARLAAQIDWAAVVNSGT